MALGLKSIRAIAPFPVGHDHRQNRSVRREAHTVEADHPMVFPEIRDGATVVANEPIVSSGKAQNRVMPGPRRNRPLNAKDLSSVRKRPGRCGSRAILDAVVVPRPCSARVHEVPDTLALEHHGAFLIARRREITPKGTVRPGQDGLEVRRQANKCTAVPTAVRHVPVALPVENVLINRLRPVPELVNQRFPDQILVWASWPVGDRHANAAVLLDANFFHRCEVTALSIDRIRIVRTKKQIIAPALLHGMRRPKAMRPTDRIGRQHARAFRPGSEIFGVKGVKKSLLLIVIGDCREDPVTVRIAADQRIGIPTVEQDTRTYVSSLRHAGGNSKENSGDRHVCHSQWTEPFRCSSTIFFQRRGAFSSGNGDGKK